MTNNRAYDALDDRRFLEAILEHMPLLTFERRSRSKVIATFMTGVLTSPYLSFKAVGWLIRKAWRARFDLWAARCRVNKLSDPNGEAAKGQLKRAVTAARAAVVP